MEKVEVETYRHKEVVVMEMEVVVIYKCKEVVVREKVVVVTYSSKEVEVTKMEEAETCIGKEVEEMGMGEVETYNGKVEVKAPVVVVIYSGMVDTGDKGEVEIYKHDMLVEVERHKCKACSRQLHWWLSRTMSGYKLGEARNWPFLITLKQVTRKFHSV